MKGWIGVDLDGTLAYYDGWRGPEHIGAPIPAMVERVLDMIHAGKDVRIFTARVACRSTEERTAQIATIEAWCREHLGRELPVTATKDFGMISLYDDRCVQVEPNVGRTRDDEIAELRAEIVYLAATGGMPYRERPRTPCAGDASGLSAQEACLRAGRHVCGRAD